MKHLSNPLKVSVQVAPLFHKQPNTNLIEFLIEAKDASAFLAILGAWNTQGTYTYLPTKVKPLFGSFPIYGDEKDYPFNQPYIEEEGTGSIYKFSKAPHPFGSGVITYFRKGTI